MNTQIIAVLISEGAKLVGQFFRSRPIYLKNSSVSTREEPEAPAQPAMQEKATEVATGCIPCAIGHLGTCSGLLNEAIRFAKSDGMDSDEVIDRAGMCLDELNAMERVDLRPEMIVALPEWEKDLADTVLVASRTTRHALEGLEGIESLEKVAAETQNTRTIVWREYIKEKMKHLTPEEQQKIQQNVISKLEELLENEEEEEENEPSLRGTED